MFLRSKFIASGGKCGLRRVAAKLYLWVMTTQEKVAAIKEIVAYHDDNLAAVKAANLKSGLEAVVTEAMNDALKTDLSLVFALKPSKALG
jgi:hypothetical protein